MNKIIEAARFAEAAHAWQVRKYTGAPYITHPARVASRVILLPDSTEDAVCAAWLHDCIEDCNVQPQAIYDRFGSRVEYLVRCLTNRSKRDFPTLDRAARKVFDVSRLALTDATTQSIKLVDRIDNLGEMTLAPADFLDLYLRESEVLLNALKVARSELSDELRELIVKMRSK